MSYSARTALLWVNQIRAKYGASILTELPPGKGARSPVEVALGPSVKVTLGQLQAHLGSRIVFMTPPDAVWEVIRKHRERTQ